MAEQVGKFLTELPELETPTDGDLMYIVDDETTSKKVTMANLKRVLGGNVTGTVEDASVSFSDGADGIPMEECEVTISPTQDLHGYSKPWAGGAGKNKCDEISYPLPTNGTVITDFGEDKTFNYVSISYKFSGSFANASAGYLDLLEDGGTHHYLTMGYTQKSDGTAPTINTTYNDEYLKYIIPNTITFRKVVFYNYPTFTDGKFDEIQLEEALTPTTYEPYSNICPISGHTDVTVTVASTSGGSGEDTTVSLGRTVYGGTLDLTTGILTDNDGDLISFTSSNTNVWSGVATSPQGVTRFYTTPSYVGRTLIRSDSYELSPNYNTETGIITTSVDGRIIITPTFGQGKTLEEFKALLATYPFDVEMTLATPQTYTLTKEQIQTLLGQNYVSHDGGGNIKVVYIRDLDITINDLIDRVTALENE